MTGVKEKKARVGDLDPPIPFAGEERIGSAMRNKNPASLLLKNNNVDYEQDYSMIYFMSNGELGSW